MSFPETGPISIRVNIGARDAVMTIVWRFLWPPMKLWLPLAGLSLYAATLLDRYLQPPGYAALAALLVATYVSLWTAFLGLELLVLAVFKLPREKWRRGRIGEHDLEFSPEQVTESTAFNIDRISWQKVHAIRSGFGYLFLWPIFPVPLRALPPDVDPQLLIEQLRSWHAAQRDHSWRARAYRFLTVALGTGLAGFGLVIIVQLHDVFAGLTQHANWWNMSRGLVARIQNFHTQNGRLPKTLDELPTPNLRLDAYGHPVHYETRGDAYLLVSFGRDGRPDHTDFWPLREGRIHPPGKSSDSLPQSICGRPNADTVVSDRGVHFACVVK